jgi:hypothetical protein
MRSALQVSTNKLVRKVFGSSKGKIDRRSVCLSVCLSVSLAERALLISEPVQGVGIKIAVGASKLKFII